MFFILGFIINDIKSNDSSFKLTILTIMVITAFISFVQAALFVSPLIFLKI